jgi:hypothetical protein
VDVVVAAQRGGLRQHSLRTEAGVNGVSAVFAASDAAEAELRAHAATEARCCPFLRFDVTRQNGRLRLSVSGPPAARWIIKTMFDGQQ